LLEPLPPRLLGGRRLQARLGVEGLRRIDAIFAADRALADLPPASQGPSRRARAPAVDAFFAWVDAELMRARSRGYVSSALGYARNQAGALRRFLDDGRLRLENNGAERALRPIAAARKSWLFFGSDDHASAAANLFSLVASCKLHGIDPEDYLRDVIRVMPYWPRDRYLELSPLKWTATRACLDADQLAREYGRIAIPAPSAAEDEAASG
jgi:transposase